MTIENKEKELEQEKKEALNAIHKVETTQLKNTITQELGSHFRYICCLAVMVVGAMTYVISQNIAIKGELEANNKIVTELQENSDVAVLCLSDIYKTLKIKNIDPERYMSIYEFVRNRVKQDTENKNMVVLVIDDENSIYANKSRYINVEKYVNEYQSAISATMTDKE